MSVDVRAGRDLPTEVTEFLAGAGALVIGDEERTKTSNGETFEAVDPATEDVLAEVPEAGEDDVADAVAAALAAHEDRRWRGLPAAKRSRILYKAGDLIQRNADLIAWLDTLDHGKPYKMAQAEALAAANYFRYFAGWVDKATGDTIPVREDRLVYSRREPLGVCAQIIPWNFPFLMAVWKVAPALTFGNTVVLKPAEQTPLSALLLVRLLLEAGVPAGAVNLVQGRGAVTGAALVAHPDVAKVAFTGSTEVGKQIMRSSADHLHKVTLELGGKSPVLVFDDAGDMGKLAKRAAFACFYNSGEVCTAGTRLLVSNKIHDEFVSKVAEEAESTSVGPGWQSDSRMGPIITAEQMERVSGYVTIGKDEGASLVAGGGRDDRFEQGFFFRPTVFDGVTSSMRLAQEEVFGPVLAVQSFDDEEEAIAIANDVSFGLAAGVFTRDIGRAHRVADRIEAGTVWVNTYGEIDAPVSFGGYKDSGMGREHGPHAIESYTQVKSVWVSTS